MYKTPTHALYVQHYIILYIIELKNARWNSEIKKKIFYIL